MSYPLFSVMPLVSSDDCLMILTISMQWISQQLIQELTTGESRFKFCIYASVFFGTQFQLFVTKWTTQSM